MLFVRITPPWNGSPSRFVRLATLWGALRGFDSCEWHDVGAKYVPTWKESHDIYIFTHEGS